MNNGNRRLGRRNIDPFDLTTVEARLGGVPAGPAIPHRIGRHSHPKARPETPPAVPPAPTGIDYTHLIDAAHQAELAQGVNYAALTHRPTPDTDTDGDTDDSGGRDGELPGQLDPLTDADTTPATDGPADAHHTDSAGVAS